jgi:7-cyano-7-deazaguanine synthase
MQEVRSTRMSRQLLLLSGGLDSTVAAFESVKAGYDLSCITFNYGQTTYKKERECAEKVADILGVKNHVIMDLPFFKDFGQIAMIDGNVFLEFENRNLAYVPFRNGIMISIAAAYAETHDIPEILLCTHRSDRICPDVSPQFMAALTEAINIGVKTDMRITVRSPFHDLTKGEVVLKGYQLNVPFGLSWSCYNSNELHCGKCMNCIDRMQAFKEAGEIRAARTASAT